MGTPYSSQLVSGYNSSAPPDDGSQTASNQITWAKIKTQLPDPILVLAQAINTQLLTALNVSNQSVSAPYTTQVSDNLKPMEVTSGTISLMDAATAGAGVQFTVVNTGSGTVTVAVANVLDMLAGTVNGTYSVPAHQSATFATNVALTGYEIISSVTPSWLQAGNATANIGYLNIPQNSQSANYTTVLADAGYHIFHPSSDANARTFTIDSNSNVPYPIGTAITFLNMSANALTIAISADTLYLSGTGSTGSRTLAQYGSATAIKMTTTSWMISGTGLS